MPPHEDAPLVIERFENRSSHHPLGGQHSPDDGLEGGFAASFHALNLNLADGLVKVNRFSLTKE